MADKTFYIIEVREDGTSDYCKIKPGNEKFYVPSDMFGPWSASGGPEAIMGGVLFDIKRDLAARL